jgi:hypothetical protein
MILSQIKAKAVVQEEAAGSSFSCYYDIIVVGLGTAGAVAAIAAARSGLSVLGIERLNCMGGTGTAGAVLNYYFGSKGGLYESIDEEVFSMEADGYTRSHGVNSDLKQYVLERHALEAGVVASYECSVIAVYLEGKTVTGLRWIGPNGIEEAGCRIVIDCTANAEVCAMASCQTRMGRSSDGQCQPFSNAIVRLANNHVRHAYTDSGYVDPTDGDDISRALIESSSLPTHLLDTYSGERRLLRIAPLLGIREGRFIEGEENVTLPGYLNDDSTSRPIFYAYSNLDNHSKDLSLESTSQQDWSVVASLWGLNISVPIPLGALIPRGWSGIMAAGRCMAFDHDMGSGLRMKRDMQKSGEAAAAAALISLQAGVPVKDVPYERLLTELASTGCLSPDNHVGMKDTLVKEDELNPRVQWLTEPNEIRAGLSGEKPGIAIWSAKRYYANLKAELNGWMLQTSDEHLRRNSALALGLAESPEAIPVLRQIVRERDGYVPRTSRKYNQSRSFGAIYLLGKLQDAEMVPELITIMENRDAFANGYVNDEFIVDENELYFQYFSFALMALLRIGDRHSNVRETIAATVSRIFNRNDFQLAITLKSNKLFNHNMKEKMHTIAAERLQSWQLSLKPETKGALH